MKLRPGEMLESFGENGGTIHYDQYAYTLTRRDHFAMAALTGLLANDCVKNLDGPNDVSGLAYELADAMEAARNKEGTE